MDDLNNFRLAISMAHTLYDVPIKDEDDAIEVGLIAYKFIGNERTELKRVSLKVDCKTGQAELPCDVDFLEAVTYCGPEDWNYTSNIHEHGDLDSFYTENYIEHQKAFLDPLYISGKFVKYKRVGNTLYTNKGAGRINVLYHSIVTDEDGLPMITDKEATAIAEYIAYTYKYKEALRTNNQMAFQIAKDLKQSWLFHCDAARVPSYIDQNTMDRVLDRFSSFNKKTYGKSTKIFL